MIQDDSLPHPKSNEKKKKVEKSGLKTVSKPSALTWLARSDHVVTPAAKALRKIAGPSGIQLKTPLELNSLYIHSPKENPT